MTYKKICSLDRGLKVLEYLNTVRASTAHEIATELTLPRPTVYRILETLEDRGLLYRSVSDSVFRLTNEVRHLSEGFTDEEWIRTLGAPLLKSLGEKVLWPTDLATFENDAMIIRESTHSFSPFSVDVGMIGRKRHLLKSPLGRAYLAFCPDDERQDILNSLRRSQDPDNALSRDEAFLEKMISTSRANGYSNCQELEHPRCASIAVPVMQDQYVIACINIVWVAATIEYDEVITRYLPDLLQTKLDMEAGLMTMNLQRSRI
ncbi:helix-turn-helix domain-containing protein [Robbsia andropogonis]|uniref:helix-turn-helix domain-containing protein n=1 Tax=Robbsia andropogonis TaxID=28092 RepID=UPI002A69D8DF|nr:helix-turn-helix domain-containing protein [Robbsia andropogonis]